MEEKRLTLKQAHQHLIQQGILQKNGRPYTLIALKKAAERGQLRTRREEAPTPYRTVSIEDLMQWVKDEDLHQRGPRNND